MIERIEREHLQKCLEIMKLGYEKNAVTFGMTDENCPYRGRTHLPYQELEHEYDSGCMMFAYKHDGELVGFLSLLVEDRKMHINDIVLLPNFQRKGFGSALMQFAKEQAKLKNCEKLVLGMVHENITLRKWYEKEGFTTVKLKKYEKVNYTVGKMELIL